MVAAEQKPAGTAVSFLVANTASTWEALAASNAAPLLHNRDTHTVDTLHT